MVKKFILREINLEVIIFIKLKELYDIFFIYSLTESFLIIKIININ